MADAENWACYVCTFDNEGWRSVCQACAARRGDAISPMEVVAASSERGSAFDDGLEATAESELGDEEETRLLPEDRARAPPRGAGVSSSGSSSDDDAPAAPQDGGGVTHVKRFIVDLDAPPHERWNDIVDAYRGEFIAIQQQVDQLLRDQVGPRLGPFLASLGSSTMATVTRLGAVYYGDELKAISRRSGMPLGKLVLLQLVYEATALCTSIVVPDKDTGVPLHIRTMDWEMEFLKPLSIQVEFQRGGRTLFSAATWAGYVGVLTGVRQGGFSVSVNFRVTRDGSFWKNLKRAIGRAWPIGFLVREVMDRNGSFSGAVRALAEAPLIAPVYFTMAGRNPGEGVLLTRSREGEAIPRINLNDEGFIVQPNMDHNSDDPHEDVFASIDRRRTARRTLGRRPADEKMLWHLMSEHPICNGITVYGCFMCPATGACRTLLPHPHRGFLEGDDPLPAYGEDRLTCRLCRREFLASLNPRGQCAHVGNWHAQYSDCSKIRCAFGLGPSNIGRCHWSCCYATEKGAPCKRSGAHEA